jgi:Fe-S cluster assembly iron-binding protein IscA
MIVPSARKSVIAGVLQNKAALEQAIRSRAAFLLRAFLLHRRLKSSNLGPDSGHGQKGAPVRPLRNPMISARMSCAVTLAIFSMACQGCKENSHESAPARVTARTEKPPPETETEVLTPPVVELTPAALAKVKEVVASAGISEPWALRLEASWPKAVCSPQHNLRFDDNPPSSEDYGFETGGIRVRVLRRQVDMLRGTEINYGTKNGQQGFIINTPNFKGELLEKWGPVLASDPLSSAE